MRDWHIPRNIVTPTVTPGRLNAQIVLGTGGLGHPARSLMVATPQGTGWVELRLCLSCGWVACSNTSPHQHAKAHYEETDHPVAGPL